MAPAPFGRRPAAISVRHLGLLAKPPSSPRNVPTLVHGTAAPLRHSVERFPRTTAFAARAVQRGQRGEAVGNVGARRGGEEPMACGECSSRLQWRARAGRPAAGGWIGAYLVLTTLKSLRIRTCLLETFHHAIRLFRSQLLVFMLTLLKKVIV